MSDPADLLEKANTLAARGELVHARTLFSQILEEHRRSPAGEEARRWLGINPDPRGTPRWSTLPILLGAGYVFPLSMYVFDPDPWSMKVFLALSAFAAVPFVSGVITYAMCRPATKGMWIAWTISQAGLALWAGGVGPVGLFILCFVAAPVVGKWMQEKARRAAANDRRRGE